MEETMQKTVFVDKLRNHIREEEVISAENDCKSVVYKYFSLDGRVSKGSKVCIEEASPDKCVRSQTVARDENGNVVNVHEVVYDRHHNKAAKIILNKEGLIDTAYTAVRDYAGKRKMLSETKYYDNGIPESKTVYRVVKGGEPELLEIYNYDKNFAIDYKLIYRNQIIRKIRFLPCGEVKSDEGVSWSLSPKIAEVMAARCNEVYGYGCKVRRLDEFYKETAESKYIR
jgi:hypothetical protein